MGATRRKGDWIIGSGQGTMTKKVGMAMVMKKLIVTILVIVSVCKHMKFAGANPQTAFIWQQCVNGEYRDGSTFQRNLNNVLE